MDARQKMINNWIGTLGGVIFWLVLGYFLFDWAWWIFLLIALSFSGSIQATMKYYGTETYLCPACNNRLDNNAQFCRNCGFKILRNCPQCQTELKTAAKFCEKCGKNLVEKSQTQISPASTISNVPAENLYCPMCGTPNSKSQTVCTGCGGKLV